MRSLLNGGGGSTRLLPSSAGAPFSPKQKPSNANLLIRVMAGRHLMVCDANGFSDPYVVIFFDQQEYRTEIQFQTLNPVWNQLFSIPVTGHSRDIQIGVYDSDRYSNDDFMVSAGSSSEQWCARHTAGGKRLRGYDEQSEIGAAVH